MDRKGISERLRSLASDDKKRSKAARLRDVIDDVEAALAAGVPRATVIEELKNHGLEMSLASFETALKRIRKKRGKPSTTGTKPAASNVPAKPVVETPGPEPEPEESAGPGSHNPADLDAIIGNKPDLAQLAKFSKRKK